MYLTVCFSNVSSSKTENPFEAKPKLARHNSHAKSKSYSDLPGEKIPGVQSLSQSKANEISKFLHLSAITRV